MCHSANKAAIPVGLLESDVFEAGCRFPSALNLGAQRCGTGDGDADGREVILGRDPRFEQADDDRGHEEPDRDLVLLDVLDPLDQVKLGLYVPLQV